MRHGRGHDRQGAPAWPRRERGTASQAIGRSRGGWTAKVLAIGDALGNLARFVLLPGQRHDAAGAAPLTQGVAFGGMLRSRAPSGVAGKAFNANRIGDELDGRGDKAVIPQVPGRKAPIETGREIGRGRHLTEGWLCELRGFKQRHAQRQTHESFEATTRLGAALINPR